jgi:hypothetical protein
MDKEKTIVVFRKWRNDGSIIALFPQIGHHDYACESYMHIGQHGAADYHGVVAVTDSATPDEFRDLYNELTRIGYNLEVRKRFNGKHFYQLKAS